jgi:Tfp pilus assembly protein PilN
MRPVNLIPAEERRGEHAPIRTGPIAYLVVGALVLVLGAVTLLVLTDNKIADRKAKVATLQERDAVAQARAQQLAPFAQFSLAEEQRTATVRSLADSRFDWERVLQELARVLPADVWLTGLTGTVSSDVEIDAGASVDTRANISGPALEMAGCAKGHKGVAGLLSALKDIDGVTRVGLSASERGGSGTGTSSSTTTTDASGGAATTSCSTRDFISEFQVVAAFDAAPTPAIPAAAPDASTAPATASTGSTASSAPAAGTSGTGA